MQILDTQSQPLRDVGQFQRALLVDVMTRHISARHEDIALTACCGFFERPGRSMIIEIVDGISFQRCEPSRLCRHLLVATRTVVR